jgi:hypothetical protein
MKKIIFISIIAVIAIAAPYLLFFKEPTFKAKNGYLNNINDKGVAIEGYDPVAYFVVIFFYIFYFKIQAIVNSFSVTVLMCPSETKS